MIVDGARKSLPNLKVTIEDTKINENNIEALLRWYSVDDEGKTIERETAEILKIKNGKIIEHWGTEKWNKTELK